MSKIAVTPTNLLIQLFHLNTNQFHILLFQLAVVLIKLFVQDRLTVAFENLFQLITIQSIKKKTP